MEQMHSRTWIFPTFQTVFIACKASEAVKVAYEAARRRIEAAGAQEKCSLSTGALDEKPALIFRWEPGIDERLPALVDAIALLVGGSEVIQEEA